MTREEVAKVKAKFIAAKQDALMKSTTVAEKVLLTKIFDELFKLIGKGDIKLLSESGRELKLTSAIEAIFRSFNLNENLTIINSISSGLQEIATLNKQYFDTYRKKAMQLKKIYKEVDATMKTRIGLLDNGKLAEGGYLDTLLRDTKLKNEVLRATRSAFGNKNISLQDYMTKIREVVVGNPKHEGGLSSHYRTFAHDTFSQFSNEYADKVAVRIGLNAAVYEGGLIETSRDFCIKKNGKVFTRKEINNWVNDPDLLMTKEEKAAGKPFDYVPTRDKGRWNCRHDFNWIPNDEAIAMRPELKKIPLDEWR